MNFDKRMLADNVEYGFTLNPEEQCYDAKNDEQFVCAYSAFILLLRKWTNILDDIVLYPEYSPAHSTGARKSPPRLHFHGKTKVNSFAFYTYGQRMIDSKCSYAFNSKVDMEYCTKNKEPMMGWCKKWKLPYPLRMKHLQNKELLGRCKSWALRTRTKGTLCKLS